MAKKSRSLTTPGWASFALCGLEIAGPLCGPSQVASTSLNLMIGETFDQYAYILGYGCNWPRVSPALVSDATGQYDEIFILSPTRSCTISFGAASCSLMTSPYRCPCLVSVLPFCIGVVCSPARPVLDLSLDTYLHHRSQLPCTCRVVV